METIGRTRTWHEPELPVESYFPGLLFTEGQKSCLRSVSIRKLEGFMVQELSPQRVSWRQSQSLSGIGIRANSYMARLQTLAATSMQSIEGYLIQHQVVSNASRHQKSWNCHHLPAADPFENFPTSSVRAFPLHGSKSIYIIL